uniref:Uncharacterized protein n=1 Tax=Rhizophora mucronata TaxID=61149 RepID=A0A2P2QYE6_RHIMU
MLKFDLVCFICTWLSFKC